MKDLRVVAEQVLAGLGGSENIKHMEPCITRIRVELQDQSKLDEAVLKQAGAHGVMKMGSAVQVVMGTQSDNIESEMRKLMAGS
ncbi:MAG TPA: PTS glucose/sucrose transporter subunit IIB [Actinomycetota bacterium]|nr:PTS glucose/sucrose transporter subunit IIB [Actinomycetota bacterium]